MGHTEDDLVLYIRMTDGSFEDAYAVAVTEMMGVLGPIPLGVEVADTNRDTPHAVHGAVEIAETFPQDLAVVVQSAWAGDHVDGALYGIWIGAEKAGAAGKDDPGNTQFPGGFEGVVATHVVVVADLGPGTVAGIAAEVDDGVDALGGPPHQVEVAHIPHKRFVGSVACVDEVEGAHAVAGGTQAAGDKGADVASGAGNQDVHVRYSSDFVGHGTP